MILYHILYKLKYIIYIHIVDHDSMILIFDICLEGGICRAPCTGSVFSSAEEGFILVPFTPDTGYYRIKHGTLTWLQLIPYGFTMGTSHIFLIFGGQILTIFWRTPRWSWISAAWLLYCGHLHAVGKKKHWNISVSTNRITSNDYLDAKQDGFHIDHQMVTVTVCYSNLGAPSFAVPLQ